MKHMVLALIAALLGPFAAQAQVELGTHSQYQTRFGMAQVTGARPVQGLAVAGVALPVEPDYLWQILGAYGLADADHDWLLATHHHGGTMCGPGITVVRVAAATVQVMGETEGCAGRAFDIRAYTQAIELDVFDNGMEQSFTTYRFSPEGMLTTPGARPFAEGIAGPGAEVLRWVGEHPYEIFRHADERGRFLTIMSVEDIEALAMRIGPATSVIQRGDWVLGAGCMAHACNDSGGVWGIRISDGAPAAAIIEAWDGPATYGPAANDPVFRAWMNEHLL